MRAWLLSELMNHADDPKFVFLTGDLGFNFLEPLQKKMGPRFINAGVAEQNMVTVAAGLAREGLRVFVYSISPFLYARAYEQIRIDICLNRLPVQMIGSGAGFDYGSMGPEHHALEDYGTMVGLKNLKFYSPWCEARMRDSVSEMFTHDRPGYLRMDRRTYDYPLAPAPKAWHEIYPGTRDFILCVGSVAIPFAQALKDEKDRPALWVVDELPLTTPPPAFMKAVKGQRLFVVEEHVPTGSAGEALASTLFSHPDRPRELLTRPVREVFSGLFGSRDFHWNENNIMPAQVKAEWQTLKP